VALSFDHTTKRIGVPQADAAPVLMQTLINAIREEEASARGIAYDQIADATGKNDLGGGISTGITVALRSTWKLDFEAGSYQAAVSGGNLSDALARVNNTGNPQVLVLASAAATLVETGVSGLTSEESAALLSIAADVRAELESTTLPVNIKKVNDVTIQGAGVAGSNPWRPA
jgi:hypothetical protein